MSLANSFIMGFHTVYYRVLFTVALYGFKNLHKYFLFPVLLKEQNKKKTSVSIFQVIYSLLCSCHASYK